MKIRNGFVSNSSSSSFVVYGLDFDYSEFVNLLIRNGTVKSDEDFDERYDRVMEDELGLEYAFNEFADTVFVGISPMAANDDETFAEFKERVKKQLSDKLKIPAEPGWISEVISD
jgi:hypothetical protein